MRILSGERFQTLVFCIHPFNKYPRRGYHVTGIDARDTAEAETDTAPTLHGSKQTVSITSK